MRELRTVIKECRDAGRAVGHFNISDSNQLRAIALASRESKLPMIVGLSEGEREFFPIAHARALIDAYRKEGVELFLNADHTYSFEKAKRAIDDGVDSIVVDGAALPLKENIALVRSVVSYARKQKGFFGGGKDVVVEAELGYIGTSSKLHDELPEGVVLENLTTAKDARDFVKSTGIDCFAPAVGNVHGMLKNAAEPRLHADRVAEIAEAARVPLVLHGASGNTKEDVRACVQAGVAVVHINTEFRVAYRDGLRRGVSGEEVAPYKFLAHSVDSMKAFLLEKIRLFAGS